MKRILTALVLSWICLNLFGQYEINRYQTQVSKIKVSAIRDEKPYILENKDINLMLDYRVGNFQAKLRNKDFRNANDPVAQTIDSLNTEREYIIQGILPINDIFLQQNITRQYFVELNLISQELGINHPVRFDLTVTNPNPGANQSRYKIFVLHGILYNHELQLPYFKGFEDEIEIWIEWNAFKIIR
jgi:hypothetical protein